MGYIEELQGEVELIHEKLDEIDIEGEITQLTITLQGLEDSFTTSFESRVKTLEAKFKGDISALDETLGKMESSTSKKSADLELQIKIAKQDLSNTLETALTKLEDARKSASKLVQDFRSETLGEQKSLKDLLEKVKKELTTDLTTKFTALANSRGGGNANRNISIGGNSSVLSRYGDINLKAGANTTIVYSNNDITKNVDVTISSSGSGGGSVIGTTRSINTISTSQVAGSVSLTDYVYICSAGINLTLPTAVGNTNLYTVKNTSTSSVLVSTTGGQTIDTQANVIMPVQFTSIDAISDSANWEIT